MIKLDHVSKEYQKGVPALNDVNLHIEPGEFVFITGKSGSGKSTLLKLISGIYTPTKGNITINGSLVSFIELGVGFNPELTGRENIFLNGALMGFTTKENGKMYCTFEWNEGNHFKDPQGRTAKGLAWCLDIIGKEK